MRVVIAGGTGADELGSCVRANGTFDLNYNPGSEPTCYWFYSATSGEPTYVDVYARDIGGNTIRWEVTVFLSGTQIVFIRDEAGNINCQFANRNIPLDDWTCLGDGSGMTCQLTSL